MTTPNNGGAAKVDVLAVIRRDAEHAHAHRCDTPKLRNAAMPMQVESLDAGAAVAELIAERDALAARLAEDRAVLDSIRNAVGGGPYDTIARRVAELIAAAKEGRSETFGRIVFNEQEANRLRAALSNIEGASHG